MMRYPPIRDCKSFVPWATKIGNWSEVMRFACGDRLCARALTWYRPIRAARAEPCHHLPARSAQSRLPPDPLREPTIRHAEFTRLRTFGTVTSTFHCGKDAV